jgi:hypothetical protein
MIVNVQCEPMHTLPTRPLDESNGGQQQQADKLLLYWLENSIPRWERLSSFYQTDET